MGFELGHGMYYTMIVTFWKSTLEKMSKYRLYGKTYYKIWVNALPTMKLTILKQLFKLFCASFKVHECCKSEGEMIIIKSSIEKIHNEVLHWKNSSH